MKNITSFGTLMRLAKAMADAQKSGNVETYEKAKAEHDAYQQLCLAADEMLIESTVGGLE